MKVLMAHNFYQQAGGEDHCVAAEVALLRAHGHEVIEYTLHNDAIRTMGRWRAAARTIWSRPAYREVRELLRAHRPQVAHFHNTFPLISPAVYYAARAESVRVVQTLHNYRLLCPNALFFRDGKVCEDCLGKTVPWPGVLHGCYRQDRAASAVVATLASTHRLLGTWSRAVDLYFTPSAFARRKFIEAGLPPARVAVKPNFIDPDPGPGTGRGGHALFVGRLSPEKGVDTLLAAWRRLDLPLPLAVVGDGPLGGRVGEACRRDPRVEWLGWRAPEEVLRLAGEAACLIVPSTWYETFGRTVIEAYARGTPVLASRLGALAELVEEGRTGLLFTPGDPADLADKVRRLLADPARLALLRRAARAEYETKYTADVNYRLLLALYERALAREVGRP